jgi:hypothetical protein
MTPITISISGGRAVAGANQVPASIYSPKANSKCADRARVGFLWETPRNARQVPMSIRITVENMVIYM